MSRTTVTNTIERIRRQLNSTVRHEVNQLASPIPTSAETLTLKHPVTDGVRSGAVLSIGTELMRVLTANDVSKEVTVIRGWQDSEAAPHAGDAEIILNPRFTRLDISEAIVAEIEAWEPDIFKVEYDEGTLSTLDQTYELPASLATAFAVHEVRVKRTDNPGDTNWPTVPFKLVRGPLTWTQASTSGLFIRFTGSGGYTPSGSILVAVALPYSSTITESDDFTTLGITGGLLELLELGTKMRVLLDAETGRSARHAQDEPRMAEEVPAGAAMQTSVSFERRYDRVLAREIRRLRNRYPMTHW